MQVRQSASRGLRPGRAPWHRCAPPPCQEADAKGACFIARPAGGHLAELTYSRANPTLIIIDPAKVDPSPAGQGIGRKLLDGLVAWARETQTKVMPLCPYAKAQFGKDAAIRDVLM